MREGLELRMVLEHLGVEAYLEIHIAYEVGSRLLARESFAPRSLTRK